MQFGAVIFSKGCDLHFLQEANSISKWQSENNKPINKRFSCQFAEMIHTDSSVYMFYSRPRRGNKNTPGFQLKNGDKSIQP